MQNNISTKSNNSASTLRDHMANERTFLAWIRTSIGIMAFGFVVEKFSLFLKQIEYFLDKSSLPRQYNVSSLPPGYSATFGIVLVALGALIALLAFFKYRKVQMQIVKGPYQPTKFLDILLTVTVFSIGLFLALYLTINI